MLAAPSLRLTLTDNILQATHPKEQKYRFRHSGDPSLGFL
jgi:hypothetical protein